MKNYDLWDLKLGLLPPSPTQNPVVPLHLAALPSTKLRARILQFKFLYRAYEILPSTLLACIVTTFLRQRGPPEIWAVLKRNKLSNFDKTSPVSTSPSTASQEVYDMDIGARHGRCSSTRSGISTSAAIPMRNSTLNQIHDWPLTSLYHHRQ
ncbi:hypothetical protein BDB00DRAFT_928587 [Zychaea mexicana]|uniref:uncharacterized protein n=1 Tax=Zychaea mexicana TaxID=64656 RepID=UPI0022FEF088|nr:uncharacterized protein BDB00DRAFT_928587 [Zychaea mexicana]KAI9494109.1 hypothetical protein BDB00DRAFT_928587 [Zychaea mexicana]